MPEFLRLLPPGDALRLLLANLPETAPACDEVDPREAPGRVLAAPVIAAEPLPAFPRSTVDGYAVRAADTYGASESQPAYLTLAGEVVMGQAPDLRLRAGQAIAIHTGGMLPEGADAVVMLEHTQSARPEEIELLHAAAVGENVIAPGEDVAAGQLVLPAGARLTPAAIGGLMALGRTRVQVARAPRVGILSSGDEVLPPEQAPAPGQVRDVNSYSLKALVESAGGAPRVHGILPDQLELIVDRARQALAACDLLVLTAGSSASARDLTSRAISALGAPGVLVHGVNVKPGKPTILAVCDGKPVIGLPGNPVSALVVARLFVVPLIERMLGLPAGRPRAWVQARLTVNLASQAGREDWVPVRLTRAEAGAWLAEPVFARSNLIFSLAGADGLLCVPTDATGLPAGAIVTIELL